MRLTFRQIIIAALMSTSSAMLSRQQALPSGAVMPTVLYGAAYYDEYMPADLQPGRLQKDVALMQQAGISVVRMGESTWSLWEPADGQFDYAWMDRIADAWARPVSKSSWNAHILHSHLDGEGTS